MQFQFEYEMGTIRLRFLVEDPDTLFNEYRQRGVECLSNSVDNTLWGTREFALYDLDRNALTFYRDLTPAEKGRFVVCRGNWRPAQGATNRASRGTVSLPSSATNRRRGARSIAK